ncbi:MAG: protein kinase, partial [Anaerolineales bacterium]|nr:protein kinase [Anaerolineales bacterium]
MNKELVANTIMPKQIGRYLITNELAKGGMATIYTGMDPRFEREVAIKVLPHALLHDPTFRTRFVREAKTVAALEHPFIVPVHDYGEEDNQPYIVMRLMRGGSLTDKISAGPLPKSEIETIMNRVNQALEVAHKKGVIHRDLKPGNILFDQYGNAFLSDFGIAHIANTQSNLTNTGGAVGTPGYMSPEQIQGRPVDGRSDIYALGILLFEMLTGQKPFVADTPAMMIVKQMTESVPNICDLNPNLPPVYDELIRRLTANNREDRPPRATYVTKMIQAVHNVDSAKENNTAVSPKPPPPAPKTKPITPRIVPKPASKPEIPPPILPLITPEPEPIEPESMHPVNDEIPSKIFLPCPHCRGTIVTNDEHNDITCPHCRRQIELTGHLCPYCNTFHEEENSFCDNCGAALTRICTT